MNAAQAAQVLAKASAYDNREVDQAQIAAWTEALSDVDLADALEAVGEHFRTSRDYLMPVNVRSLALARKAAREREAERGQLTQTIEGDPRPENLEELTAAFKSGDPVRIEAERAKYDRQLVATGRPPVMKSCPPPYAHSWDQGRCLFCGRAAY